MYSVNIGTSNLTRIREDLLEIVDAHILEEFPLKESADIFIAEIAQQVVAKKIGTNKKCKKKSIKAVPLEKRTLVLADQHFEREEFKKAKNLYKTIINSKEIFNDLQPTSCWEVLQNIHLCRMKLWLNESQLDKQNELLFKSLASLKLCLNTGKTSFQNKKIIFNEFAYHLFKRGEDLLNENHSISSFVHFKLLLQLDLSYVKFIDGFDEIINIILLSMRECMVTQENKESGSSERMNNEMIKLLDNPLINLELQVENKRWLIQKWESHNESSDEDTMIVEEQIKEFSQSGHRKIVPTDKFEIVQADFNENEIDIYDENLDELEMKEAKNAIEIDVELETDNYIIFKDSDDYTQWIEEKDSPNELSSNESESDEMMGSRESNSDDISMHM